MAIPIAVSGVATPENKVTHWRCVTRKQENRHQVPKSVLRAVLERMQFTLHATRRTPHGASRLVQAMSVWLVKSRRAPSRHSRDARVYGHTTTAMHKLSTPPPPPAKPAMYFNECFVAARHEEGCHEKNYVNMFTCLPSVSCIHLEDEKIFRE